MSIKMQLTEEFNDEISEVSKIEIGSKEHSAAVDSLTKLADRIIEIDKIDNEQEFKDRTQTDEAYHKDEQLKVSKIDTVLKHAGNFGKAVLMVGAGLWVYSSSMKYEEKGIIPTTDGGRSSIKQFLNFIKL